MNDTNKQIEMTEKIEHRFGERMNATIKVIVAIMVISYILIVWPLYHMGITTLNVPVVGFVASTIVIPVLTFFAGFWIVWKFKFIR